MNHRSNPAQTIRSEEYASSRPPVTCMNSVIVVSPLSFSFRIKTFDEYRVDLVFEKYGDCASLERGCIIKITFASFDSEFHFSPRRRRCVPVPALPHPRS